MTWWAWSERVPSEPFRAPASARPLSRALFERASVRVVLGIVAVTTTGCAAPQQREVMRASRALAGEVETYTREPKGRATASSKDAPATGTMTSKASASKTHSDRAGGLRHVASSARNRLDREALRRTSPGTPTWARALRRPTGARPEVVLELSPGHFVEAIWTDEGWRFAEDPTQPYAASTPRQAFAAFVRASKDGRWDVLVDLAPQRFRAGLTADAVEAAWTSGEGAESLRTARDRLEKALNGVILEDGDSAALEVAPGAFARAERERNRWVVVQVP